MRVFAISFILIFAISAGCKTAPDTSTKCKSTVKYSGTNISFGGVEIPLGKSLSPIKIANFTYTPEQIQPVAAGVDVLEQHRLTVCGYLELLTPADRASRVDKLIEEEERITTLALVLRTDPSKVGPLVDSMSQLIASSVIKDTTSVSKNPKLKEALDRFGGSSPGTPSVTPIGRNSTRWELKQDIYAGDCIMHSGSFVEVSGNVARYSLVTSTTKSTSGDVWHHYWKGRNNQGRQILSIGPVSSDGRMYPGDGKRTSVGTTSVDGAEVLPQVVDAVWLGQC